MPDEKDTPQKPTVDSFDVMPSVDEFRKLDTDVQSGLMTKFSSETVEEESDEVADKDSDKDTPDDADKEENQETGPSPGHMFPHQESTSWPGRKD